MHELPEEYISSPVETQAELAYADYKNNIWEEDPRSWSPLINLEQLENRPDLEVDWYCPDWIPVGAKTFVCGEPKIGKTIAILHVLNAIVSGRTFLGQKCEPAKVMFLTEQTEAEIKMQIKEVPGLIGNPNFYLLLPEEAPEYLRTWMDTLKFVQEMITVTKSKIVVFDTFGGMAKLPPGGENDAATIQNHINMMSFLFRNRYLSVVCLHHNRKKNEDPRSNGDNLALSRARGSTAFIGGGGHIIMVDAEDPKSCERQFGFYGRYINGETKNLILRNGVYEDLAAKSYASYKAATRKGLI